MTVHEEKISQLLPKLELYSQDDPDKFESVRSEIIQAAIDSYPERYRQRAQGLQFSLNCELDRHKDPASRMNRMIELFWEKVGELNLALNNPATAIELRNQKREPAKVISLF